MEEVISFSFLSACLLALTVAENTNPRAKLLPDKVSQLEKMKINLGKNIDDLIRRMDAMDAEVDTQTCAVTMGCYLDKSVRDLNGAYFHSSQMTHQMCIKFCKSKYNRFKFAAVQYHTHCFCGNNPDPSIYPKRRVTECRASCKGNSAQMCGGSYRNTMFNITACYDVSHQIEVTDKAESQSCAVTMGCYVDTQDRALNDVADKHADMTHEMCIDHCKSDTNRFKFAAVQNGEECRCGNELNTSVYRETRITECSFPCKGNENQMCGASFRNTVFDLTACYYVHI